jgi:hypothetical protein
MTHENKGHYAKKHPPDRKVKPEVADALKKQISDKGVSCSAAHKVASDFGELPAEVGVTLDFLEAAITKCQLGLFGYCPEKKIVKPAETILPELEEAIGKNLSNNRISCKSAWEVAESLKIKRMEVASACEALKIKISPCQLGAF